MADFRIQSGIVALDLMGAVARRAVRSISGCADDAESFKRLRQFVNELVTVAAECAPGIEVPEDFLRWCGLDRGVLGRAILSMFAEGGAPEELLGGGLRPLIEGFFRSIVERMATLRRLGVDPAVLNEERLALGGCYLDVERYGLRGFEVVVSALIVGRADTRLWLRCRVRGHGSVVSAAAGWESWTEHPHDVLPGKPCAAILPIEVQTNVAVFDALRVFIPYAALSLTERLQNAEIELSLLDRRGAVLIAQSAHAPIGAVGDTNRSMTRSPHERGVWLVDPASGSTVHNVSVRLESALWDGEPFATFVVDGVYRAKGFATRRLSVEARLYHPDGKAVGARFRRFALGELCVLREQLPIGVELAAEQAFRLRVPLAALDVPIGVSRVIAEVVVLRSDGRAVCGTVCSGTVSLSVEELQFAEQRLSRSRSVVSADAA